VGIVYILFIKLHLSNANVCLPQQTTTKKISCTFNPSRAASSQLHTQSLGNLQTLSNAQIQHNLLRSTRDSISAHISIQTLNLATLSTTAVTQPTEDLTCLASAVLEGDGTLSLETGDGTAKTQHGLLLAHRAGLEDERLEPRGGGLDLSCHVCQLEPDNGVLDEFLAEGAALVGVFYGFFVANPGEADTLDDYTNTLVVEVGHDD
jgi:hypothetical protein